MRPPAPDWRRGRQIVRQRGEESETREAKTGWKQLLSLDFRTGSARFAERGLDARGNALRLQKEQNVFHQKIPGELIVARRGRDRWYILCCTIWALEFARDDFRRWCNVAFRFAFACPRGSHLLRAIPYSTSTELLLLHYFFRSPLVLALRWSHFAAAVCEFRRCMFAL